MTFTPAIDPDIEYPDSDGKPMADNTEQYEWIVKIKENLEILFANSNARRKAIPSVGMTSTGRGKSAVVKPSRKRPSDKHTSGSR